MHQQKILTPPNPSGWRAWPITKRFANEACRFLNLYHNEQNEDPATNGELWLMRQFLPQAQVVFDIGANVGDWSLLATQHLTAPGAKIYAWEPLPATAEKLRARLPPNAEVICAAASDHDGTADIWLSPCNSTLHSLHKRDTLQAAYGIAAPREKITITTRTLDSFCTERAITHIDFLKIDVEGHEVPALRGFRRGLHEGRARLIQLEYGGAWIDSRTFLRDLYYEFENTPYTLHKLYPDALLPQPLYDVREENFLLKHFVALCTDG
jgi:FkbM family methyltransferase